VHRRNNYRIKTTLHQMTVRTSLVDVASAQDLGRIAVYVPSLTWALTL